MTMNRTPLLPLSVAVLTLVAGLSTPGAVVAAQGQGTLAQAPLQLGQQVPPAFIMAVDDSGSMTFETLFPGRDGYGCTGTGTTNPFFDASNELRTNAGANGVCNFHHVMPYPGHRIGTNRYSIPPLPMYGFARSPEFNASYFNPATEYPPWIDRNGAEFPQASITATRADPRNAGSPAFNMTANHRDRVDDGDAVTDYSGALAAGDYLQAGWQIRNVENTNQTCATTAGNLTFPSSGNAFATLTADRQISGACATVVVRRARRDTPENDERFRLPIGTLVPAGTWYYIGASCGGLGTTAFRLNNWTYQTTDLTTTANCDNVGIEYFPASFYLGINTPAPAGFNVANRILSPNAGGNGVDMYKYEIKPGNYANSADYDAAIQSFANWFTYYGNRNRAMIAGMTRSLVDVTNMYVGFFTINNRVAVNMRNMAAAAEKSQLYDNLLALPAAGGTPNRFAVDHIGTQFQRTGAGAPVRLACQRNAGMLFTDGYSNGGGPNADPQNADGGFPSPLADAHSNTLADLAAEFYTKNLRPDLPAGRVPVPATCPSTDPRVDCNPNLHMNFYGVTLGARGDIYGVDTAATADPYANPPAWGPRQDDAPSTVDEIWHAALNGRGKFINAQSPAAITTAMREILAAVGQGAGPSGSIALTGARVGDTSFTVVPGYAAENRGTDWYGQLRAERVTVSTAGVLSFNNLWEASTQIPAPAARRILYAQPNSLVNPAVNLFTPANVTNAASLCNSELSRCTATEITGALGLNVTTTQAVNYLRGERTLEGTRLRTRTSVLGDIINSNPEISSPKDNYGYRTLRGATLAESDPWGYQAYLTAKSTRRPVVYAGANDGMLHAFDGENGTELFGYIPSTALGHMGNLLFPYNPLLGNDQKFQHRYFVDGPITVSDARINGTWRTVLVGSSGAGGKSVFALNVSNPGAFTSGDVLWEVSRHNAGTTGSRMGNVLGKPIVVPTREGTSAPVWKAVFGNGFGSADGRAALYVVNMNTRAVTTIEATHASLPALPNGLSSVALIDRWISNTNEVGRDGYADTAYAADQLGNIWKFDLRNNTVANGGQPIFSAIVGGVRQPITGGLEVAAGPGGGVMIYFGTGSYAFEDDTSDGSLQTLYAVLDRSPATPATVTRSNLGAQTLAAGAGGTRVLSNSQINYVTQSGWYMDLATGTGPTQVLRGERFVGNPRLQSGLVLFPTFEPGGAATDPCATGGTNWLYAFNAVSGAAGLSGLRIDSPTGTAAPAGTVGQALDTGGDIPVRNVAVLLAPPPAPPGAAATVAEIGEALGRTCDLVVSVPGAPTYYLPRACGRQSWRQIR
ncbi:PilC/PilY family type IV pilus protein [Arenimonas sp.]|uniref:pilus assembly protein n=1 Tax=Arenimonas sp. TaxID=1872635 RepID=UPI0025B9ACAE|nr:PilC/PilY family type IV pilus protein [Arenimonas sp.]